MYSRSSPKRQSLTPTRCLQPDRLIMLRDEVSSTCWYTRRPVISSAVDRIRTEAGGMWRQICVQVSGSRGVWAVPRSWPVGGQGASVGSWDSKITCRRATERGKVHHINTAILSIRCCNELSWCNSNHYSAQFSVIQYLIFLTGSSFLKQNW